MLTMLHAGCCAGDDPRLVGDPVDTLTGAVFDGKLEFRLTGPLELWWWRHYDSSQHRRRFALGWGHTHDFDRTLRFDADGLRYEGPLGREVGFAPLVADGDQDTGQGFRLRRLSIRLYQLFHHGAPAMEFEFHHPQRPARLKRLFSGDHEIVFEYDAATRLERIVDALGRTLKVVEAEDGRLVSVGRQRGAGQPDELVLAYEYDERGNLVSSRHASGHGYSFAYDDANRMVRRTGRNGFTFRFEYDDEGRCVKASGDGRLYEATLDYSIPGRVTRVTRADGGVWTYFFDEAGGLAQIHDPLGGVQEYVRDPAGRVAARVDPAGNTTRIVHDEAGAPVAEIDSLGYRFTLPRDPNAPDPMRQRVAANPAEYEYGRLVDIERIVLPSEADRRSLAIPPDIRRLVAVRPERTASESGEAEVRPLGVRWWPDPARGWVFNDFGKLVQQQDDLGRLRRWTYDAAGNVSARTDFDGRTWAYDHGKWHFLEGLTNPVGAEVLFTYTTGGQIASCTDAGGTQSVYGYDFKGELVEVRRHGRVREKYTCDAAGNMIAKHTGSGRELLTIEIGPGNLPVSRKLSSGDEHALQYDDRGRYRRVATRRDEITFAYDPVGRLCLEKRNGLGVEHRFTGCATAPSESVFFGRYRVRYDRRGTDGSIVITDPGGARQHVRRLEHGMIERRFSNGSREFAQYDGLGRCVFKSAQRVKGGAWNRRYKWSGEGELLAVDDGAEGEIRHEYDAAHRLRRRILPGGRVEDFELDAADNLVRQPGLTDATLQAGNRLQTVNGHAVVYDDRDHIAERHAVNGPVRYVYDSRDQLIRAETTNGAWTAEYDGLRRRSRKAWAGRTTEYHWNGDQLIAEVSDEGRLRLYVYLEPLAMTPLFFLEYDSADAPPESCRRYFVFGDQIGTPLLIEDDGGDDVWRARIEPFGRAAVESSAAIEFNLRFPGHYFDGELGLHYNRFRHYDPALGRYLQSDPWGIAGGFNLYAYRMNPLLQVDVRGLGEENDPACNPNRDRETAAIPPAKSGGDYDGLGLPMTRRGEAVDKNNPVQIFKGADLEQFRVVAGPNGELVYPNQGNRPVHSPDGNAIWVMDRHGNMYVHESPMYGSVHHSSLAGGEAPVAGGHIAQIGEPPGPQGPHMMSNSSGHYEPTGDRTILARDQLASDGVDTSGTRLEDVNGDLSQPAPSGATREPAVSPTGPTSPETPSALGRR